MCAPVQAIGLIRQQLLASLSRTRYKPPTLKMGRTSLLVAFVTIVSFLLLGGTVGCPLLGNPGGDEGSSGGGVTHRERDISGKLVVAVGGMASGGDEILIEADMSSLDLRNEDPDLFTVKPRPGFSSFLRGKGGKVVALKPGIGYVTPIVNGKEEQPVEVTIPPQSLLQILVGEARGQLTQEATLEGGSVKTSSVSVTGDALGAVIRNRIHLINDENSPSLFLADAEDFRRDPPASSYDAVIAANDGLVYQFSPVEPSDPSHEAFEQAKKRVDVVAGRLTAYDQAALTAGPVFNDDLKDPTGGAFAFYSPTEEQFGCIQSGLNSGSHDVPSGCGTSDENFPAFAPVQILILPEVATVSSDGRPSFVFVRQKGVLEPAITNAP